jgi:hypothetical protein
MNKKTIFRAALVFLLLAAMFGCNGDSSSSGLTDPGILKGIVSIGPLCPVETPPDQCKPRPDLFTSHVIVIYNESGSSIIATTAIHTDGSYQVELNAGNYLVDYSPHDIGIPGSFTPLSAAVEAGKTTTLDIHIDTGIR